jgi:hypothetical protein
MALASGPIGSDLLSEFVALPDPINALADQAPGLSTAGRLTRSRSTDDSWPQTSLRSMRSSDARRERRTCRLLDV